MTTLQLKKVARDLWINRSRSLMAVTAVAIGVIGIGTVLCAYQILVRELDANYARTRPPSATITVHPADAHLVSEVRRLPGIGDAEARGLFQARIRTNSSGWKTLLFFVIDDFGAMKMAISRPDGGSWPPRPGEILIERAAFRVLAARIGDAVTVRMPGIGEQKLRIGGGIHDPAQAPAWMEGLVYGYASKETLAMFGPLPLNEVLVTVANRRSDRTRIRSTVKPVTDWMEKQGYPVQRINVPEPGHHPHQSQLKALLFLLEAFGILCFVLSIVLVITLVSAMMAQQTRQIGVMKAIGARTGQITRMYVSTALVIGSIALIAGIPLSVAVARAYVGFAARMLNFEIVDASVPLWTYLFLVMIGLVTPALCALYPVYRSSRITVREAITDYGIRAQARGLMDRAIDALPALPRPLMLSLRNGFRRKGRIALTLGTMAVGGAVFITALNIGASITKTIGVFQNAMRYDLKVVLNRPLPSNLVVSVADEIPGVVRAEAWSQTRASLVHADGADGNEFTIIGPPSGTDLLTLRVIEGRGLSREDANALVVNHVFMYEHPDVKLGNEVVVRTEGQKTKWRIVGIIRQIGQPTAFANYGYLARLTGQQGLVKTLAVVTAERSVAAHRRVAADLERAFQQAGIEVTETTSIYAIQQILEDHFLVLTMLLLFMSALIVIVGGLGLMTTMSIQVIERTREIGVMRAIGVSTRDLFKIIGVESLVLGLTSWLIAVVLAVPLSKYVGDIFGLIFLRTTLDFAVSPGAFVLWLGVVVVFSTAASYFPGRRATNLTVRETLAYE